MSQWMVVVCVSLACLAVGAQEASAQAWIREAGSGFVDLSVRTLSGDEFYDRRGDSEPLASTYRQTSLGLYGELGLIDRWLELTVSGEALRRNELEGQGVTSGLGDFRLGLWSGLSQEGPVKLSLGVILGLPTGDPSPSVSGSAEDAELVARSLPTGDGEFDVEPNVTLGASFGGGRWPLRHYLVASLGYQVRTKGFNDALSYRLELGTRWPVGFLERVWLIARVQGLESLGEPSSSAFVGLGDGVTFTGVGVSMAVELGGGFGASLSAESAVRAENIISGIPVSASVHYTF